MKKYYKATRVAHITVTERNFNEAGVDWQINNETGVVKSGWSHNGDTHTCDVSFTKMVTLSLTLRLQTMQ